jgi:hypothetical protein
MKIPFVIYADFEAILEKIHTCEANPAESYTEKKQKHTPSGFCYYIKSDLKEYCPKLYRGKGCAAVFTNNLIEDIKRIYDDFFKKKKPMQGSVDLNAAGTCCICEGKFDESDIRVCDHDHFTGRIRGVAHQNCNINYKDPTFIPVLFHNMSNYDIHLFIKELSRRPGKFKVIPSTEEKYVCLSYYMPVKQYYNKKLKKDCTKYFEIRFLDSYRFLPESLEKLVGNLPTFPNLEKHCKKFDLFKRKGVYPYEYMDRFERFEETKLPAIDHFYSSLSDEGISNESYKHAKKVWTDCSLKNLGEYHDVYLKSDVLLLADVFENFRDICLKTYKLDCLWYYTSPGLSWDALLQHSQVNLELLHDVDMLLFFEKQVRGGTSFIAKRFAEANNKYMKTYDSRKPSRYLIYEDANNLYGAAMSCYLPVGSFKWLTKTEIEKLDVTKIDEHSDHGYVLECDVRYPQDLHDTHSDYPFLPERLNVNGTEKLIPNLMDKSRYIVHYRNLQQALQHGLILTKIHRAISFKQQPWMKSYIAMNTKLRQEASNDFEKDFYKLMNNSVFGKTMENMRKRIDVRLVTNEEQAVKLTSKPNYHKRTIFSDSLTAVHMKKNMCYL